MLRHIAVLASAAFSLLIAAAPASAQAPEPRIALVIGNAAYASGPLQTSLNDAGLVAEALRSIGFDIVDGADLSQADMVRTVRDFVGKVEAAGPGAVAFVYFSGYGFAYEGDNYLVAADARLERENEIPLDTVRLSDLLRALDGVPARGKIVAIDAARQLPFGIANARLAPGLSALEAPSGTMIAYSTEPGQVFEDSAGAYGPYATAIAEMVRTPAADIVDDFIRVRARVAQLTEGRQLPWNVSALGQPVVLVPGDMAPVASAALPPPPPLRQPRPMPEFGPDEGYAYVIERNELPLYAEYVEDYPDSPYAPQIWAIIRTRREALCWMRAVDINTPEAYWTYRHRYPHGIYAFDAERRLHRLSAPLGPPTGFVPVEFAGVPPPLRREPAELVHFHHSPHAFAAPPAALIHRQPVFFARLAPPPHQAGARILPSPVALPVYPKMTPGHRFSVAPWGAPLHTGPQPPGSLRHGNAPAAAIAPGVAPGLAPTGPRQPGGFHPPGPPTAAVAPNVAPNAIPGGTEHRPGERREERLHTPPPAPAIVNRTPPAAIIHQPPPTVVTRPPPPVVTRPPPPPPPAIVNRAPPPAAVVNRPPPPPPVVNRAPPPPPPVVNRPPPPAAAAAKKCVVENGKQVCR